MRAQFERVKLLVFSATAKDTYTLFVGNLFSAFWGFLFTLIVARALSISNFGIFSAALNFVIIITSLADVGISSGIVNFVSAHSAKGEHQKANEYIKAAFLMRLFIVLGISLVVVVFSSFVANKFLATSDFKIAIWSAVTAIFLFPDIFFPPILQAKNRFLHSTLVDNAFYIARLAVAFIFYLIGGLTISTAFWAFGAGFLVTVILVGVYFRSDFLRARPQKDEYKKLLSFSGWIAVNRIVSSISGRLDVQMVATLAGAFATGLYSIPSRLASFIIVLASSFSSVLAPRMAAFGEREKEKAYIVKSTLALVPIIAGIIIWILLARPFIFFLFGAKYLPSVPIFQALAAAQIPFLFTVPSVTAIIYAMKKTVFIGSYSFFQIVVIFLLNLVFIPKFGPIGPTITFAISNTILAIYTWVIVVRHYWLAKK